MDRGGEGRGSGRMFFVGGGEGAEGSRKARRSSEVEVGEWVGGGKWAESGLERGVGEGRGRG